MVRRGLVLAWVVVTLAVLPLAASTAEMYFSSDQDGGTRVTNVQEGAEVWICVYDPDENIDCDVRDKFWTDVKLMDPKTGAYIMWISYVNETGSPAGKRYDEDGYVPYKGHYPGNPGWLDGDYLEETGANTSVFVSSHPFQIGTRESFGASELWKGTHVVDVPAGAAPLAAKTSATMGTSFQWGNYSFLDVHNETKGGNNADGDVLYWVGNLPGNSTGFETGLIALDSWKWALPSELNSNRTTSPTEWLIGRFENMDTLIGMVQDPNEETDVAVAMMKIIDTEATITWDSTSSRGDTVIYKDGNEAATIRVVDADENLNCNRVEYVPVFIIVNPGSWNPANSPDDDEKQTGNNATNFCMLKRTGGIAGNYLTPQDPALPATPVPPAVDDTNRPIRWFNIYNAEKNDYGTTGAKDGRYYIHYPKLGVFDLEDHGSLFDTVSANGVTAISFYARETGVDTGIFELKLNSILADLGFTSLNVNDTLVAYYLDPNDEDDFKLAVAYIGSKAKTSQTNFTDATRMEKSEYWLGRDAVYVQVIDENANVEACCPEQIVVHICNPHDEDDGEFWALDETSSNSSIFFSNAGMELLPVWDALGVGLAGLLGGYQLVLDNWKLEAYNEDDVYVRYNDVDYVDNNQGMFGLGDESTYTAYSGPRIDKVRVSNDVSYDLMSIADTQVYDGSTTRMHFLDRNGNEVEDYVNSDCVFLEVIDDDQDEDLYRRERIDGFWDEGQNIPFGPLPLNAFDCTPDRVNLHPVNALLGDTNIFNNSPNPYAGDTNDGAPRIYVLNPRSGRWAALDLLETNVASGVFISVICVDLVDVYTCVPTLGVLPGDTIVAFYQDPSNHSDSAVLSIKVSIGGNGTATEASCTEFIDTQGNVVDSYVQGDPLRVRITDLSHTQDVSLSGAVSIGGATYDLTTYGSQSHMFVTDPIVLDGAVGEEITATYVDPTDPTDTSSATVVIVSGELEVTSFYAGPNPFNDEVAFAYDGSGIATTFSVEIYDLAGHPVWAKTEANVSEVIWTGVNEDGNALANGAYIYVLAATDGTNTFDPSNTDSAKGIVFVNR